MATYPLTFSLFLLLPFLILCHFLLYHQSYFPWECDRSHSLLCCITFARGHRETAENLCRYSRSFNRVCPQSNSLWKWPPAQRFDVQAADPRSPIQALTQRKAAWLGRSPGTGHLPHTEHCRSAAFLLIPILSIYWAPYDPNTKKDNRIEDLFKVFVLRSSWKNSNGVYSVTKTFWENNVC